MSNTIINEAHIILEQALVAYLKSLVGAGGPLDDLTILEGHSEQNLDNMPTRMWVFCARSDTQPFWTGGLERVDVQTVILTQATDSPLAVHNRRVAGMRTVFDLRNYNDRVVDGVPVQGMKTIINATPNFTLSGWCAMDPPLADGFDKESNTRQAVFRHRAVCGIVPG